MSQKLSHKVAVITGGSSGIGLATAKLFVAQGAKVVITGRNQEKLNTAVQEIGIGAIGILCDSSNLSNLDSLYLQVKEKLGNIDVLIANAAVYLIGPLVDYTEEMFDKQSDTNFKGTFFTVQRALPYLNDGAAIVLVSSVANEKGIPGLASYSATKAAIRSMGRSFSAELLPRRIRVNVLSPGPVDTNIFAQTTATQKEADKLKETMTEFTPINRIGKPDEIAAALLYLCSPDSQYILGAELLIDGGVGSL